MGGHGIAMKICRRCVKKLLLWSKMACFERMIKEELREVYSYVLSDYYRYSGNKDFKGLLTLLEADERFRWQVVFRLSKTERYKKLISVILLLFGDIENARQRIQIPSRTQIGYGLYIGHGGPAIVNPTAIIGNNCNLSQFVTIGANDNAAAVLGDNVYIGPSVCLVENVRIGNNVTIGAGSVVTHDVPEGATVAGNYARVLNYNNPGRYIKNRWREV